MWSSLEKTLSSIIMHAVLMLMLSFVRVVIYVS